MPRGLPAPAVLLSAGSLWVQPVVSTPARTSSPSHRPIPHTCEGRKLELVGPHTTQHFQIQAANEDLRSHLEEQFVSGAFSKAFVVIMADHGHCFAQLRETHQGQLEERLPFFLILIPMPYGR